jgi:hypothetical protein
VAGREGFDGEGVERGGGQVPGAQGGGERGVVDEAAKSFTLELKSNTLSLGANSFFLILLSCHLLTLCL